jgi:hypothetical protein
MTTECNAPAIALDYTAVPALGPAEKTAAVTRVRYLEGQLFDESGPTRRGVTEDQVQRRVSQINQLRHLLGWLEIDLHGRWRWPN